MAKFISIQRDDTGVAVSYIYEAKDGTRYTGPVAAVVEAAADAHDEVQNSTLGRLLAARRRARAIREAAR